MGISAEYNGSYTPVICTYAKIQFAQNLILYQNSLHKTECLFTVSMWYKRLH